MCWAFELWELLVGQAAIFLDDCLNLPVCSENKNECHSHGIPEWKGCAQMMIGDHHYYQTIEDQVDGDDDTKGLHTLFLFNMMV